MKKILFLILSYPNTRRSASVLCTKRVMEFIASSGRYEVHALCMQYHGEVSNEVVNGIVVHRFRASIGKRLENYFAESSSPHWLVRMLAVLQKTLTIPCYPQTHPLTMQRYYKKSKQLQKKERFDLIVSEHHGLETLLAGCKLKRDFDELKHIAIFWDPLNGELTTKHLPMEYVRNRVIKTEKFVSKCTTLQISTSSMKDFHQKQGDIAADHRVYLDIPSILPPDDEVTTEHLNLLKEGYINIVFSGLLSVANRNPLPIIRLLGQCKQAERINIVFFSMGAKEAIENEANVFKGSIIHHDYISLAELHTIYRHADYLLSVSHVVANMVPSKIFEYMSFGKPIISTFVTDGDSAEKYISKYKEGLCIDLKKSESENVKLLNSFLDDIHKIIPFDEVKSMFKENTPDTFLQTIDFVLEN